MALFSKALILVAGFSAAAAADANATTNGTAAAAGANATTAAPASSTAHASANTTGKCHDVHANETNENYSKCYKNVLWAKETGFKANPEWYSRFVGLDENSSFADFQCVLWRNTEDKDIHHDGHDCGEPCAAKEAAEWGCPNLVPTPEATAGGAKAPAPKKDGGMPAWAWVLIVLGVCCGVPCLGLACSAWLCYEAVAFILDPVWGKRGAQKKKRAVKKAEPPPAVTTSIPVATTSIPMPVYHTTPIVTTVLPAPQVTYAAPMAHYAAPASYAVQAQPVYADYAAHPASVTFAAPSPMMAMPAEPVTMMR